MLEHIQKLANRKVSIKVPDNYSEHVRKSVDDNLSKAIDNAVRKHIGRLNTQLETNTNALNDVDEAMQIATKEYKARTESIQRWNAITENFKNIVITLVAIAMLVVFVTVAIMFTLHNVQSSMLMMSIVVVVGLFIMLAFADMIARIHNWIEKKRK